MLTDPKLRSQVDALWDKFWTGGLSNLLSLQEEFAPFVSLRGSATGMVARVGSLPLAVKRLALTGCCQ